MDRSITVRGNRTIFQNFRDGFAARDNTTGVYRTYIEYYSDNITKFVEITLAEFNDETENYDKAIYNRYDSAGNIIETKTFDLVYVGRGLIDIDGAVINNDFYSNDKLESVLNYMVNIAGMEAIAADHAAKIDTLEDNVNLINNGLVQPPKYFETSLLAFVEITESTVITEDHFGKILKCSSEDEGITLTIPAETEEDNYGVSAHSFDFIKTGTENVILEAEEGVELLQPVPGTVQQESWTRTRVTRVAQNKWLVEGALSNPQT